MKKFFIYFLLSLIFITFAFCEGDSEYIHIRSNIPTDEWGEIISETYWLEACIHAKKAGSTRDYDANLLISLNEDFTWNFYLTDISTRNLQYANSKYCYYYKKIEIIDTPYTYIPDSKYCYGFYLNNKDTPDGTEFTNYVLNSSEIKIRFELWNGSVYGIKISGENLNKLKSSITNLFNGSIQVTI